MDKLSHQVTQNVHIKNKLNEANHDYQTLRRRAVLRRNDRLRRKSLELQAIDKKLLHDVGVESFKSTDVDSRSFIEVATERMLSIMLWLLVTALVMMFIAMSLGI